MRISRNARPTDESGKERQIRELATLNRQLEIAEDAGDQQTELERVADFLEINEVVRNLQLWRELATVTP